MKVSWYWSGTPCIGLANSSLAAALRAPLRSFYLGQSRPSYTLGNNGPSCTLGQLLPNLFIDLVSIVTGITTAQIGYIKGWVLTVQSQAWSYLKHLETWYPIMKEVWISAPTILSNMLMTSLNQCSSPDCMNSPTLVLQTLPYIHESHYLDFITHYNYRTML